MNKLKRIQIWYSVLKAFCCTFMGIKNRIIGPNETVNEILKKRSLIRFGDGEFGIFHAKSIHYQNWSPELKTIFEDIKKDYEKQQESCSYLLALPKKFLSVSGLKLIKKRVYVSSWSQSRYDFKLNFLHDIIYGDAFLFERKNKDIYSKIWLNDICPKTVIFVHNSKKYASNFASMYNKNVIFVQCPGKNAFEAIEELEKEIHNKIYSHQLNSENVMLIFSAGPAGKALVYKFSKLGFWGIDAGHCWDDPLEGI